uniref:Uncharacterized protein n=1 Tax=Nelumbo nucifera TaxID=4432 RepID=A0A822YXW1_NELNU|nr:TPA_asm: hypothetical protein HUJ06_006779 [Nelumbo nucifera]
MSSIPRIKETKEFLNIRGGSELITFRCYAVSPPSFEEDGFELSLRGVDGSSVSRRTTTDDFSKRLSMCLGIIHGARDVRVEERDLIGGRSRFGRGFDKVSRCFLRSDY